MTAFSPPFKYPATEAARARMLRSIYLAFSPKTIIVLRRA